MMAYLAVREVPCAATRSGRASPSSFLLPTFTKLDGDPSGIYRGGLNLINPRAPAVSRPQEHQANITNISEQEQNVFEHDASSSAPGVGVHHEHKTVFPSRC